MHGNETTTTKAVINLLKKINAEEHLHWLQFFSFTFLPILNPDGAEMFTRVNANEVDLNRDSANLSQPESKLLRTVFEEVQPNLALNMHDQDRKSTRLNSSHVKISYAVFCLKQKIR